MTTIEGVDYSYDPPSPNGLVAAGKKFVVRYGGVGKIGKLLTAAEAAELKAAGLGIVANVEETAQAFRGSTAGVRHAAAGDSYFKARGMPADRPIYFSVDWDAGPADWPAIDAALQGAASVIGLDRVGVYGGYDTIAHCATTGTATWFWQTYAWSGGKWHPACHLQQYKNNVVLADGTVDLDRAVVTNYGQWGKGMTFAPARLLEARRFYIDTLATAGYTINPLSVGIVGDDNHAQTGNSYHLGKSALRSDSYSIVESPRDRAGLTEAAAALDLGYFKITVGGKSHDLRSFSIWLVAQCKAGTADTRDLREVIYSPDGQVVRRWDRLGVRTTGDSSHTGHTHQSWFRDSETRDKTAHLRRYFTEIGVLEGDDMTEAELLAALKKPAFQDALYLAVLGQDRIQQYDANGNAIPADPAKPGAETMWAATAIGYLGRDTALIKKALNILSGGEPQELSTAEAVRGVESKLESVPAQTVDQLKMATATPEQKAELLRAVLGDDAAAVGRLLAGT